MITKFAMPFKLSDHTGKVVIEQTINSNETYIETSHLQEGFYIIQVYNGSETNWHKILIIHS